MKNANNISVRVGGSFEPMSDNAKAILKKFLTDPNTGKLWSIDVPAIVDDEPTIPNNYRVRGILGELSVFERQYRALGYQHFPTATGYDFTGPKWVQVKTLSNPDGAVNAMKKAIDALIRNSPEDKPLLLHILKRPRSSSDVLESQLETYRLSLPEKDRIQVQIQPYDLSQ